MCSSRWRLRGGAVSGPRDGAEGQQRPGISLGIKLSAMESVETHQIFCKIYTAPQSTRANGFFFSFLCGTLIGAEFPYCVGAGEQ